MFGKCLWMLAALGAMALLLSCGGGRKPPVAPGTLSGAGGADQRRQVTLDDTLSELAQLAPPEGVDAALFSELKDALRDALTAKGASKIVSKPPTGEVNKVDDLALTDNGDGTYTLTWSYRNVGDYNQDGIVNISDITPLAVHFNEAATPDNEWIDGNADSVINISDITPLAVGFFSDCAGYNAEGAESHLGPWNPVSSVPFAGAQGAGRLGFEATLTELAYQTYHVVPFDALGTPGEPSRDTLSSQSLEVSGVVQWDDGWTVGGATVIASTQDGSSEMQATTDIDGNFTVPLAPMVFPTRVLVEAEYVESLTRLAVTNFKWTDEIEGPGTVDSLVVTLPNPAGNELYVEGNQATSWNEDIIVDGLPAEVKGVFGRAYDPDENPEAFPGAFEEQARFALNSSAFLWITGTDAGGQQVDELSSPVDVRLEIPTTQWGDLTDILPDNGQIDVPIYDFNYDTGLWQARGDGWLVDESGNIIPEQIEPEITSGSYAGRIYAKFSADHFSYWNCDFPYVYVWTLSRLSPEFRNTTCFYNAVKLAEKIAKSQKGRDAYARINKPGHTLESEYLTDGKPDNANKQAPEINAQPMDWGDREVTKGGHTFKPVVGGLYHGRVTGRRQDEFYLNSKLWSLCRPGSSESDKKNATFLMAVIILHEFGHQKQHVKRQEPEPEEIGKRLEKDIFDGHIGYSPGEGLTLDGDMMLDEMRDVWLDPANWPPASGGSALRWGSDLGDSGLTVEISSDRTSYGTMEPLVVDVTFRNDGSQPIELIPADFGLHNPLRFEITDEFDEPVEWVGPIYNLDFTDDSYVILNPAEEETGTWNLRYDDDGHPWRYDFFETGTYQVKAVYTEFLPPYDPVESNTLALAIEEQPPGSIAGTVTDVGSGLGIGGATVRAVRSVTHFVTLFDIATTQPDGTYLLSGLQPMTCTVEAFGHNHVMSSVDGVVVVSEQTTQPIDFALTAAQRGDWWMFGREPKHNGRSPFIGAQTNNVKWSVHLSDYGIGLSSPAIADDGTIYIGAEDYSFYAVLPSGIVDWSFETGGAIKSSPALGLDGKIYFGSDDGYFYALNPDGSLAWKRALGEPGWHYVRSSPAVIEDGTIYVGSYDGGLYAFQPDGTLKWRYQADGAISCGPAVSDDGSIYVGSYDVDQGISHLHAVDSEGYLKWIYEVDSPILCTPSIGADGTLYFGSADGRIYALTDAGTEASLKWRVWGLEGSLIGTRSSPAIADDGTIYIGAHDVVNPLTSYLLALNPADGSVKWQVETESTVDAAPTIGADGLIYVGDVNYNFKAYDPLDGSVVWGYATGDWVQSSAAIGEDGTVYVGSWDGYLYAFGM